MHSNHNNGTHVECAESSGVLPVHSAPAYLLTQRYASLCILTVFTVLADLFKVIYEEGRRILKEFMHSVTSSSDEVMRGGPISNTQ